MPKRERFHVTHSQRGQNWQVKREGRSGTAAEAETKEEAVSLGRDMARRMQNSQLIVHRLDGRIQTEYTYGNDPRRSAG